MADKFYVSAISGSREALALGPFDTKEEAMQLVEKTKYFVCEKNPWAFFYLWGTAGIDSAEWGDKPLPVGTYNQFLEEIKREH